MPFPIGDFQSYKVTNRYYYNICIYRNITVYIVVVIAYPPVNISLYTSMDIIKTIFGAKSWGGILYSSDNSISHSNLWSISCNNITLCFLLILSIYMRGYLPTPFYQSIFIYFFTFIFMFISFITKYLLLLSIVTLDSSNVVFFYLITAFKSEGYREFFFV